MAELERVYIEDLKVGDEVCVPCEVRHGWIHFFRYPLYKKTVVERITPKKTKLVTRDCGECDKHSRLFKPNEETTRQSIIAGAYNFIANSLFKLDRDVNLRLLNDEEMLVVANKFKEIRAITDKYIKDGGK